MIADFSKKYAIIVESLKQKMRQAQMHAALTFNVQMFSIYWEIGKTISEQENSESWGNKNSGIIGKRLKVRVFIP